MSGAAAAPPGPSIGPLGLLMFVLVPGLVAGGLTLQNAPPSPPPQFRAEAVLLVHRMSPGVFGAGSGREGHTHEEQYLPSPPVVARLVSTGEVAERAREIYVAAHGEAGAPTASVLLAGLKATNDVLADTAVRRDVSPTIHLSMTLPTAEESLRGMRAYAQAAVEKAGSLVLDEVRRRHRGLLDAEAAKRKVLDSLLTAKAAGEARVRLAESRMAMIEGLIRGSEPGQGGGGLLARTVALRVRAAAQANPLAAAEVQRELAASEAALHEAQTSLTLAGSDLAMQRSDLALSASQAAYLEEELERLREPRMRMEAYVRAASLPAGVAVDGTSPAGPELRQVSGAVMAVPVRSGRPPLHWAGLSAAVAGALGLMLGLGLRRPANGGGLRFGEA